MALFAGTSGYDYDEWVGRFYPPELPRSRRFAHYAARFPTVESNYTFATEATPELCARWAAAAPPGFRFALKAWRGITHHRRLRDVGDAVARFDAAARALGDHRGPSLYQLPPNLRRDDRLLGELLAVLPAGARSAIEFRDASWFDDAVFAALASAGVALCVAEDEELATPAVRTASFGYLRLRRERYPREVLRAWAERIARAGFTDDVFVYFKHEERARGVAFAKMLSRCAEGRSPG